MSTQTITFSLLSLLKKLPRVTLNYIDHLKEENAKTCVQFAAFDNVGIGLSVGPAKKQDWQDCIQTTLLPFS